MIRERNFKGDDKFMETYKTQNKIIGAPVEVAKIRKAYTWWSKAYFLFAPLEKPAQWY